MVDYLNDIKITPPDCSPYMPHFGKEDNTVLHKLLLAFRLGDNGIFQSKKFLGNRKWGHANNGSNDNSKASDNKWKVMEFYHLPMGTAHSNQTVLEEEQKALVAANNELMEHRLLFEEEKNHIKFFMGDGEDIVILNVSGTIMATKRSFLGPCKNSFLAKQFDDPLWTQNDKTEPEKQWSCEKVSKWDATIKGLPDDIGPALVRNNVNWPTLLVMGREDLKEIGMTKSGPLDLLLKVYYLCGEIGRASISPHK